MADYSIQWNVQSGANINDDFIFFERFVGYDQANDNLFYINDDFDANTVVKLNGSDGSLIESNKLSVGDFEEISDGPDKIFVAQGDSSGAVLAISKSDLTQQWIVNDANTPPDRRRDSFLTSNTFVVEYVNSKIVGYNVSDGSIAWENSTTDVDIVGAVDAGVYIAYDATNDQYVGYDMDTGNQVSTQSFQFEGRDTQVFTRIQATKNRFVTFDIVDFGNRVDITVFDVTASSISKSNTISYFSNVDAELDGAVLSDDVAIVCNGDKTVAKDMTNGNLKWDLPLRFSLFNRPLLEPRIILEVEYTFTNARIPHDFLVERSTGNIGGKISKRPDVELGSNDYLINGNQIFRVSLETEPITSLNGGTITNT